VKSKIRALGIDDSPFSRDKDYSYIIGSVVREKNYLEGILIKSIKVDGMDSTEKIIEMLKGKFSDQIKIVLMNGITFGGFNVTDIEKIYNETGIPVVTVVRKMPSMNDIEKALKKHFIDWEYRLELMKRHKIMQINGIYVQASGIEESSIKKLLEQFTVRGKIPEPIRISHMIGSAIVYGYSKRKA
jgi:endonuclease V-like protein UPF0215 family